MGDFELTAVLISVAVALVLMLGIAALWLRARVRVPAGSALVIHGTGGAQRVSFVDTIVPPLVARWELVDCSVHVIAIACEGTDALRCRDSIRVDVRAEFQVAINRTVEDVLKVVQSVGSKRAGDAEALRELFAAKFTDAVATVLAHFELGELGRARDEIRDRVIEVIGRDLNGFVLSDMAFTRLEQVPLEQLDPSNVLDAEAIRRITERTAPERVRTQEIQARSQMEVTVRKLEAEEATLAAQLAHERLRPDRG